MRSAVLALHIAFLFGAGAAEAQRIEVGANVASACLGSDGSACGNGTHPLIGAHVSWWGHHRALRGGGLQVR
jgi:hypothetical protein